MNKKNMKKWMALFLSLAMILTSGVLTISPGLLASEENTYENSAQEDSQGASEENAEAQQTSQEAQIPEAQNSSGEVQLNRSSQNRPLSLLLRKQKQTMRPFPCRPSLSGLHHLTALP